jgi:hypothetical protein
MVKAYWKDEVVVCVMVFSHNPFGETEKNYKYCTLIVNIQHLRGFASESTSRTLGLLNLLNEAQNKIDRTIYI